MFPFLATVWVTFWLILCVHAYDSKKHTFSAMVTAWAFISMFPLVFYKICEALYG